MKITCPECGFVRIRSASQVAKYATHLCQPCRDKDAVTPTVCPDCGKGRLYTAAQKAKLKNPVCRDCRRKTRPNCVKCPHCGKVRFFRPATVARLKQPLCRQCCIKEQRTAWVKITCPRCGRERDIRPAEVARHYSDGYCYGCETIYNTVLPDTFDAGYVTGIVLGDGSLYVANPSGFASFHIRLQVTSAAFARKFTETLGRCTGKNPHMKSYVRSLKGTPSIRMPACDITVHDVSLCCREWYEKLKPVKKDRNFDIVRGKGLEFQHGFLCGMIDSDGCVNQAYTDVANKDVVLLDLLRDIAVSRGYRAHVYGPYSYSRGVAHLRINVQLPKTIGD